MLLLENENNIFTLLSKKIENEYKSITEWTDKDLDQFLFDSNLISVNTIQSYISIIRKIHKVACDNKKIKYKELNPTKELIEYVDFKRLRSKTIMSWEELFAIRNELIVIDRKGRERNFREVALLMLAWYGLSAREIQYLKEKDIHIFNIDGNLQLKITLPNRTVVIDHPQAVSDILNCINEKYFYKVRYYSNCIREEERPYIDSIYLIKTLTDKRTKVNQPVNQPSILLARQLAKIGKIGDSPLDLEHLSLEDIRRSALIWMINRREGDINLAGLKAILGKKQEVDLIWLKQVAKRLKEMEEERLLKRKLDNHK